MTTFSLPLLVASCLLALTGCAGQPEPADQAPPRTGRPRAAAHLAPAPPRSAQASVLDLHDPQISHLDPALRAAVEAAAEAARADGVPFWVTSGWRSAAHQQRLLDAAIARYGSREEALRYVSTPETSRHVTGDAVDIGPAEADRWLAVHGSAYGLCQVLENEAWHFELATVRGGTCPVPYADAAAR